MRAFQLTAWKSPPELPEVPDPEPGPGQVVVRIAAAGACHSDLHLMHDFDGGLVSFALPFTLGHENAGFVEAVGAGVDHLAPGEPVAVYGSWGCGRCRRCHLGAENYCERAAELDGAGGGLGFDGGMAPLMLVPHARWLVPLGDLEPVDAAPLTDAGLTPYHAIKRSLHLLHGGSTAVVIGAGGLGHLAVQILKATSAATVVAVDTKPEALEDASRVGRGARPGSSGPRQGPRPTLRRRRSRRRIRRVGRGRVGRARRHRPVGPKDQPWTGCPGPSRRTRRHWSTPNTRWAR
jgi:alcohol dehydrogenase, propanol-preferring